MAQNFLKRVEKRTSSVLEEFHAMIFVTRRAGILPAVVPLTTHKLIFGRAGILPAVPRFSNRGRDAHAPFLVKWLVSEICRHPNPLFCGEKPPLAFKHERVCVISRLEQA